MIKVNNNGTKTYFAPFYSVSIVDFEQVNVSWEHSVLVLASCVLQCNPIAICNNVSFSPTVSFSLAA